VIGVRIGSDIDGVLTSISRYNPNIKLPWWIFLPLIFVRPNERMVKLIRNLSKRDVVIIVSARPERLEGLTRAWLRFYKIPFYSFYCVGLGRNVEQRKLKIIQKEKIKLFIDNDAETVDFLKEHGINARLP